jgi:mTERF domain-containing protein, mitochondrial
MNLHMDKHQMGRLLLSYPQMLDYNFENTILPITAYMMQELGFSPTEFRQILLKFPRLVTHSLYKIKHVVG